MDSFRKVIKMGANLKTCKRSSSSSSAGSSCLLRLLKLECLRSSKIERKRAATTTEMKKENSNNDTTTIDTNVVSAGGNSSLQTLGQWLLSSPGSKPDSMKGGELYVLRSHYSSRRVHPSSSSSSSLLKQPDHAALGFEARDSFSMHVKNDDKEVSTSKLSRTKSKKKVSFRLPEEADIIVFDPSEDMVTDCEQDFV